jgi:hypothetical protein
MEAAIGAVSRSQINVTFSDGSIRKQVPTAARAPGTNAAGNGSSSSLDRAEASGERREETLISSG